MAKRSAVATLHILLLALGILFALLSACTQTARPESTQEPFLPADTKYVEPPTPTAFQPMKPTATPDALTLWISPAIPPELRLAIKQIAVPPGKTIQLVSDPVQASIRVEPNAEHPLTVRVYALVVPFPTAQDGETFNGLREAWQGDDGQSIPIYASDATAAALASVLGSLATTPIPPDELLSLTWDSRPAGAIVPFEELEPRWKVLELDGISPVHNDFEIDSYPLAVTFGLSGEPADVALVRDVLDWPSTNRNPDRLTVLVMTGTTALTRSTALKMDLYGPTYPGERIGHWLRNADLAHISNEVPFTASCPPPDPFQSDLIFCSSPRYLDLLIDIGVDLVELTGNHVNDWGREAFLESLDLLGQFSLRIFGGGEDLQTALQPALFEHNGNQLAFIGCNAAGPSRAWATETAPGAAPCDLDDLLPKVDSLRQEGFLPIFTFQWAEGAVVVPAQREAFRSVVDAGAVIVSGSQAHQPLGMEFYQDGWIHYGLGNLFFDQMQSLALRQELIDRHVFYEGRHISTELLTAILEDYAQPRPMTPQERESFLLQIFSVSGW